MFKKYFGSNLSDDLPSALVVFLVALPLCLGIAVASGAPPLSGLIAGIVGGIVVGSISGSHISVSGPAAGLTSIVLSSIEEMGSFQLFLGAVVMAGVLQFILGALRAGVIGYYFPTSVIKGMLAGIGLILILKQIPHGLGFDADFEGDESFFQPDNENTFTEIIKAFLHPSIGAIIITIVSLSIILIYETKSIKRYKITKYVPGALIAVVAGILLNELYKVAFPELYLSGNHLVRIPVTKSFNEFTQLFKIPDFSGITTQTFWITAVTIALVASIETLLSIEAADKLDPQKRVTPASRELRAQGIGNTVSGLLGGLPVTAVIVRSSANAASGAKTKVSAILHGILLFILILIIPKILNLIPLSALAAVLLFVGYKLTKPSLYKTMYKNGLSQFLPFVITVLAILFTNLLVGIGIGMVVGLLFVMKTNFHAAIKITKNKDNYLVRLKKDVSFLNKALLLDALSKLPKNCNVLIKADKGQFIDHDIEETLRDFVLVSAPEKGITVKCDGLELKK
ncbi:MAG: SulP family inorganic anion transporter [Bacteroidia bacterium]